MRRRSRLISFVPLLLLAASLACAAPLRSVSTHAQRHRVPPRPGLVVFVGGYFYDPFFGPYPWWSPAIYPYAYFPVFDDRAEVRVLVTPKEAAVYVDGYYAGIVDDFDGFFQRLPLTPGPHEIDLYLPGYRTVHQRMYLAPRSTYSVHDVLERLGPGEVSEPPNVAPPLPPPPPGTARLPRTQPGSIPQPSMAPPATAFGTLAIRVRPADADVFIDGESWSGSIPGERLLVQVSDGTHRIEIQKDGFQRFSSEVVVRAGEMVALNVSLTATGKE